MEKQPDYRALQRRREATMKQAVEAIPARSDLPVIETSASSRPVQQSLLPPYDPQEEYYTNPAIKDFQDLAVNHQSEREQVSNMFSDWELFPRYNGAKLAGVSSRGSLKPLPIISHICDPHRDVKMVLTPAQLKETTKDGDVTRFYFPDETEKLVEWALVKMATENAECLRQQGNIGSGYVYGVQFSLSGLRSMMYSYRRGRKYGDIVRALEIMNRCHLEIQVEGKATAQGPLLTSLKSYTDNAYKKNSPESKWMVTFHPLINMSIESRAYRQHNFERLMTTRSAAAAELYKEMLIRGRNISRTIPYRKSYLEFSRTTGLLNTKRRSDGIRAYREIIDELISNDALSRVEYESIHGKRKRVDDVIAHLYPSDDLIREIKASHYRDNHLNRETPELPLE